MIGRLVDNVKYYFGDTPRRALQTMKSHDPGRDCREREGAHVAFFNRQLADAGTGQVRVATSESVGFAVDDCCPAMIRRRLVKSAPRSAASRMNSAGVRFSACVA
jgi:hypothetical protein